MRNRWFVWLQAVMVCSTLMLTGCENSNLFGKLNDRGDSSDPQVLTSQGYVALREGDYTTALNLFNKALSADPDNAEALYGASAAQLAGAGLNIGAIVSNLSSQSSSSLAISNFSDIVAQSRVSVSAPYSQANSILNGVDLAALDAVIDQVICRLQKIVSGAADGSIQPNNLDVLLNLASICVIRGILRPIRNDFLDVTNVNGTWSINTSMGGFNDSFCNSNQELILRMAKDLMATYHLFNRAATQLNLNNDALISKIRTDVLHAADLVLNPGASQLPSACITNLNAAGINYSSFQQESTTDVFTVMPGGC
jgi:tetratricopeptide (TPR) repeat protein